MPKVDGKALADALRARLMARQAKPGESAAAAPPDLVERLGTLDQLRAAGALSDTEYDERRTQILDSL
ncbi:SHOCT domain-containing protein [Streptomyces beijiangensis]|uniref:SHOCT domain-containing protein n=1 Tax=Streptomyces beijiangensis TaxID=163361 RepID=UPI00360C4186